MPRYFLGVDIGNTKSHAVIADEHGQALGFGAGGCGNHEVVGEEGFKATLQSITQAALQNAGITAPDIVGAGFGVAGFDWPSDRPMMDRVISALGLVNARYDVVNDGMIGLLAGAKQGWGVNVSAGTSSNARGRDVHGKEGRVTGNGATFGEYGGGHELVEKAVEAIGRAWSKRGPETLLTQLFIERVGAKGAADFLEGVARGRYHVHATDAPLVFDAAKQGDVVAREAILWMGRELGNLAVGIIRQLELEDQAFEVVLAGSFYDGSPLVMAAMRAVILEVAPGAILTRLNAPPVVGSVLLGMEQAGVDFAPLRKQLLASTNRLFQLAQK